MTLISVYNSSGCIGRCDAHCYEAKHPGCTCICGGKNHGVGLKQATDNVRRHTDEMVSEYAKELGLLRKDIKTEIDPSVNQMSLF